MSIRLSSVVRCIIGQLPSSRVLVSTVPKYIHTTECRYEEEDGEIKKEKKIPGVVKPRHVRVPKIENETSVNYMDSDAYKDTYGDDPVWKHYRMNFKGQFQPTSRETCIRREHITTANPCPLCRDYYLRVHYTNVKLLKQFIDPHTGDVHPTRKTKVCQKQQRRLLKEVTKAKEYGFIEDYIPFKSYNYSDYIPKPVTSERQNTEHEALS